VDAEVALSALIALADKNRLAIFKILAQEECLGLSASDIGKRLYIRWSTLSYHLSQLKRAGLLNSRRHARTILYSADQTTIAALFEYLNESGGTSNSPH